MPKQTKPKPKRKRHFTPRFEGDTYANYRGDMLRENKRLESALAENLETIARKQDQIRRQEEARDRIVYHCIRLGGENT